VERFMLKYLWVLTALAKFGAGSLKTIVNDAINSADAATKGKIDDNDRPDRSAPGTFAQSEASVRDGEIIEPTHHDDDSPYERDERNKKAARFAIACYLAQQ
jgi:hypothetical protein